MQIEGFARPMMTSTNSVTRCAVGLVASEAVTLRGRRALRREGGVGTCDADGPAGGGVWGAGRYGSGPVAHWVRFDV